MRASSERHAADSTTGRGLDPWGQVLVDALLEIRKGKFDSNTDLIRYLAKADLRHKPSWAELESDGVTVPQRARSKLGYVLGTSAYKVPDWADVETILEVCLGEETAKQQLPLFATFWMRSRGRAPDGYTGEFSDATAWTTLTDEPRAGGSHRWTPESVDAPAGWTAQHGSESVPVAGITKALEEAHAQLAAAKLAVEQAELARSAAESEVRQLRAELDKRAHANAKDMLMQLSADLRAVVLENYGNIQHLHAEIDRLLERLVFTESNGVMAAEQIRRLLGRRVVDAEQEAAVLKKMYETERYLLERNAHTTATIVALGAGVISRRKIAGPVAGLRLPTEVVQLFDDPDFEGRDSVAEVFMRYLRTFLIAMYSDRTDHPDIPYSLFDRVVVEGEFPTVSDLSMLLRVHPLLREPVSSLLEAASAVQHHALRAAQGLATTQGEKSLADQSHNTEVIPLPPASPSKVLPDGEHRRTG